MFETLTGKLAMVFRRLDGRGRISSDDLDAALREVRLALLGADVNVRVARDFVAAIRSRTVGVDLMKSVSPSQQVVKAVHDELVALLGGGHQGLQPRSTTPSVAMLVGLQGSGKTTTAGKLALYLRRHGQRSILVAGDLRRPAAIDQLESLGRQLDIPVYSERAGPEEAPSVVVRGLKRAQSIDASWCIVDTGGRLHIDNELMDELERMRKALNPAETLLVVDAMTGQDALNAVQEFHGRLGLTGVILSKLDGDARGGAALTVAHVTGVPVKFAGVGEKVDALEAFHPERMASRILGMGDVLSLVEKAQEQFSGEQAAELERKLRKAQVDLDDFLTQLRSLQRMGPLSALVDMLPKAFQARIPVQDIDEQRIRRMEAIISSMTSWERRNPDGLTSGRRRRIAQGSGTTVTDVNQLLGLFQRMQQLLRQMQSGRRGGLFSLGLPRN